MNEPAFFPQLVEASPGRFRLHILASLGMGVALISILAQVAISLPFTPVPVTGQTLGVALVALLWGRKQAVSIVLSYLALGALGLPIFALGNSGLLFGPTMGYLLGMLASAVFVGYLSDRGWSRSFGWAFLASLLGSLFVFGGGLIVLLHFLPRGQVLRMGLFPFLPGDFIKCAIAAQIASSAYRFRKNSSPTSQAS